MGNEFTGFEDNAPTLTLEPDLGEPKAEISSRAGSRSCEKRKWNRPFSPRKSSRW